MKCYSRRQAIRIGIQAGLGLSVGGFFSSLRTLGASKVITPADDLMVALSQLLPGDTLTLRGGTYPRINNTTIKGTSSARIIIKSFPGETAIVNGGASISGGAYLTFEDIIFHGGGGFWFGNGTRYVRLLRGEVRYSSHQGIHMPHIGDDYNEVIQVKVHHNGSVALNGTPQDHGFYIAGRYNLVDGCDVYSNFGYGAQIFNGYAGERADGNVIRNTKSHHNGTGGNAAGLAAASGSGNQIINCESYSNPRDIDVAWGRPANTIVRGNKTGTIFINSDATGTLVENNCIDPAKIDNRAGSQTTLRNNSPTACGGSSTPPPPTNVDVTQNQPPPPPPPSTSQPSGPSTSQVAAPFLVLGVLGAALLFGD